MERSVIFFSFCSLAILAGSIPIGSSTIGTLWNNTHDIKNVENYHADSAQENVQNNTKHLLLHENPMKNTTQIGEHASILYLNKASDASTTSIDDFSSSYIKDMQHLRRNGDRENDAYHKGLSVDLSSHDILLDPGLISARLSRQAEQNDMDYSNHELTKNNYDNNRSVVPSKPNSNLEIDLGASENRYQSPYPYWNPYYRGQFPNQRYRANDRREPYRNYWRYPVFPGK